MRILVTGMTNQQAGEGTQLKYEPVADLFVKALRHQGHKVAHTALTAGDDIGLEMFEAIFVGIVPPLSIASKYLYQALHAIAYAEKNGVPLVLYLDDWAFPTLITKLGTCSRGPHHLVKPFFARRPDHAWAVDHLSALAAVIDRLLEKEWPPTIIPAFTWGDHDVLAKRLPQARSTYFVDPSSFAREYEVTYPEIRDHRWVLGTVSDQREWLEKLELSWPVRYIGSRSSKAPERLSEAQLVQVYAENRGVLSPPYHRILGTGWWRNRLVYAARTRSILLGDFRDYVDLGDAYAHMPRFIETLSDAALDELANYQREELFKRQASADEAAAVVGTALDEAMDKVR